MKKRIRFNGFLIFLFTAIFLWFHKFLSGHWKYELVDDIIDAIGLIFIYLGFLLRMSARGYKSERLNAGTSLVSGGLYSLVRNPMYLGTFCIGLGIITFIGQWWLIIIFIILFLFRFLPQIKLEEKTLSSNFGSEYQLYCNNVPRLFPNILFLFKKDTRQFLPLKIAWIKKEISPFVTVIIITSLIEIYHDASFYGKGEYIQESLKLISILLCFVLLSLILIRKGSVKITSA